MLRPERQRFQDQQVEVPCSKSSLAIFYFPITAGSLRRVQSTIEPSYILAS